MYDIRQFRPTLYLVLLLGLTGFCLSAELPALWVFSILLLGLNAWLIKTRRFRPLPRWLTNIVTLLGLLYIVMQVWSAGRPPLMFIGQFLVLLHFVKLFEDRPQDEKRLRPWAPGQLFDHANRDYTQLLILSLLLMVAAAINTADLFFAALLLVYIVISLYCCLLFHLKVEADRARKALAIPEEKISPLTLKQDQRFLNRSMRRLTGLISVHAVTAAVLVFLFFPRGPGQGVLGQLQLRGRNQLVGFSDKVAFDQINDIKQNDEIVAHVAVWRKVGNGPEKPVQGGTVYFRGYALDRYEVEPPHRREWRRYPSKEEAREILDADFTYGDLEETEVWRQHFILRPTGSKYLFALPGLLKYIGDDGSTVAIKPSRGIHLSYQPGDDSIQSEAALAGLEYDIYSTNTPRSPSSTSKLLLQYHAIDDRSDKAVIDQIRAYTERPDVLGKHTKLWALSDENEEIARRIEHHLRTNFTYTLNLTRSESLFKGMDPIVAFLTKVKAGHCEYFASAMTLMCQSLNIPARVVVGFKCDEYNAVGGYYIVRQAHAHTWVEVLTPRGWVQFDPTSGREDSSSRAATVWQSLKHFFDYLEYKWAENVVAYDTHDRDNLLRSLDAGMTSSAIRFGDFLRRLKDELLSTVGGDPLERQESFYRVALDILGIVLAVMVSVIVLLVVYFLIQQHRLRQRAARIGLDSLPLDDQLRLARQLAFYDQLTRALHHANISRPRHLTHREFADSLVFLPAEAYGAIKRLTDILYRIRFGRTTLSPHRQRRLETVVSRLAECLPRR